MNRSNRVVKVVMIGVLAVAGGNASAEPTTKASCVGCDVTFSVAVSNEGSRLQARDATGTVVEKHGNRQGLSIALTVPSDRIDVTAAANGTITLTRHGRTVVIRPDSILTDYEVDVKSLTADSAAAAGLERMVMALHDTRRPEALSVVATWALLRSLHGDPSGNALLAERTSKSRVAGIRPAAQRTRADDGNVLDCWAEYEQVLSRNFDRYSLCLREYWWNQPVQYACGLEFAMVAELAMFRLIACSGGFPLP